jgi:putative MFS transporter
VNFGFLLRLPNNLRAMGMDPGVATVLPARSALLAVPGIALVIWLDHRWSSIRSLVLFAAPTVAALGVFCAFELAGVRDAAAIVAATVGLLVSASGVIAMLIPYAAEIYPLRLRGTGAGLIAASSKFGGILGAVFGVLGLLNDLLLSGALIGATMAVAAIVLARCGIETRGRRLEEIEADAAFRAGPAQGDD